MPAELELRSLIPSSMPIRFVIRTMAKLMKILLYFWLLRFAVCVCVWVWHRRVNRGVGG